MQRNSANLWSILWNILQWHHDIHALTHIHIYLRTHDEVFLMSFITRVWIKLAKAMNGLDQVLTSCLEGLIVHNMCI